MKKKLILLTSAIIALTFAAAARNMGNGTAASYDTEKMQKSLADKILRFRIIADSDSKEDQELKLLIRENVVDFLRPYMEKSGNIDDTKEVIENLNGDIIRIAEETIKTNIPDARNRPEHYSIRGEITKSYFPVRTYGEATLPAGEYETYLLVIGGGQGQNWWCMLYPPLCFTGASIEEASIPDSSKEMLKDTLTADEYSFIMGDAPKKIKIKFKYLTFLNKLFGI